MEKLRKVFATDFAMFGYDPFSGNIIQEKTEGLAVDSGKIWKTEIL